MAQSTNLAGGGARHCMAMTHAANRLTGESSEDIRDLGLDELERVVSDAGERSFRAKQLAGWIYSRGVESFDAMLDLPKGFRKYLKHHFTIGSGATATV